MKTSVRSWSRCVQKIAATAALASGMLGFGSATLAENKPNVVFILVDDIGVDAFEGQYWSNELSVHTPNLAALSQQGVVFTNARACPNCSPTRAGIMTGRTALQQGVIDILSPDSPQPDLTKVALQTQERTIGESLRDAGYYTVMADKWHCGWNSAQGQLPTAQGFDQFFNLYDYQYLDDSLAVGDEHISNMVNMAVEAVLNRPAQTKPFALFFWSLDAHERVDPEGQESRPWWKVSSSLLPSGENYYSNDTDVNRYRAVIEALDTELGRLLRELGVVDANLRYRPESNTVVFVTSDNGTPVEVSPNPAHAKGTLYDDGIRVPLFVLGANVPSTGAADARLLSYLDFYDTLCDVGGVASNQRGTAARMSYSFADHIGWSTGALPDPQYVVSSRGDADDANLAKVALVSTQYKLICKGGGFNLAPLSGDEFYDLSADPDETDNLVATGMTGPERNAYNAMRDALVSYWGTAVGQKSSINVDIPVLKLQTQDSKNNRSTTKISAGFDNAGSGSEIEARVFVRYDIGKLAQLLPNGKTIDDVVSAQVILTFKSDSTLSDATDTGPLRAYRMTMNWYGNNKNWSQIVNAFDGAVPLGVFDPAPNIITNPQGNSLSSVPMIFGTPMSLGQSTDLAALVRDWYRGNKSNDGIVVKADMLNTVGTGDQRLNLMTNSILRVSLR